LTIQRRPTPTVNGWAMKGGTTDRWCCA